MNLKVEVQSDIDKVANILSSPMITLPHHNSEKRRIKKEKYFPIKIAGKANHEPWQITEKYFLKTVEVSSFEIQFVYFLSIAVII
jgi:hypothetical protein